MATQTPSTKKYEQTIRQTMRELMRNHGYSRMEASQALVKAMALPSLQEPSEDEITRIVNSVGIGADEAKAALMVAATLDETCRQKEWTLSKALADVTKRMTTKYILQAALEQGREESDAAMLTDDTDASSATPHQSMLPLGSQTSTVPWPSPALTAMIKITDGSHTNETGTTKETKPPASAKATKKSRSRLADITEATPSVIVTKDQQSRAASARSRSDSVDTQVHQKLETAADATVPASASVGSVTTRSKRARSDDATTNTNASTTATLSTTSHKRTRSSRA